MTALGSQIVDIDELTSTGYASMIDRSDSVAAVQRLTPSWKTGFSVSVLIPTVNEALNLALVLPRIPDWVDEVILVDGVSEDGSADVARALLPHVRVISEPRTGKGAALRAGFNAVSGDIVVMLDGDGSTDPGELPRFIAGLLTGADLVKGSRFVQGGGTADMSLLRRFGNGAFVWIARLLFGSRYSDLCYGFIATWSALVPRLRLDCDGFEVETVITLRALSVGLKVAEVPSFEARRIHGKSHLRTFPDGWRVLKAIWHERRARRALREGAAVHRIAGSEPLAG
jgi:glycosyltransferase involved in cell wall biosynthesis